MLQSATTASLRQPEFDRHTTESEINSSADRHQFELLNSRTAPSGQSRNVSSSTISHRQPNIKWNLPKKYQSELEAYYGKNTNEALNILGKIDTLCEDKTLSSETKIESIQTQLFYLENLKGNQPLKPKYFNFTAPVREEEKAAKELDKQEMCKDFAENFGPLKTFALAVIQYEEQDGGDYAKRDWALQCLKYLNQINGGNFYLTEVLPRNSRTTRKAPFLPPHEHNKLVDYLEQCTGTKSIVTPWRSIRQRLPDRVATSNSASDIEVSTSDEDLEARLEALRRS